MEETQSHAQVKRRKTTSRASKSRWADLPTDVLLSVAYKASYPSSSLYATVGHVCTRWRAAIASALPLGPFPCHLPVLALQQSSETSRCITAFPEEWRDHVRFWIPRVAESGISGVVGSCHGWLVVLDPDAAHLAVRNPATGHAIHFPSLLPLITINVAVHRVIVSHDPALHKDFVVLLFLAGITTRCFTFRRGANAWAAHAHRAFHVEDVIFFSGRFIAVDKENNLGVLEWRDHHLAMTTRRLVPRRAPAVSPFESVFLVDLSGILLVATVWCDRRLPTTTEVWKGRRRGEQILEVDFSWDSGADGEALAATDRLDLDGHAVFLGHGNSVAVDGAQFPALGTDVVFCPIKSSLEINATHVTQGAVLVSPYNLRVIDNSGTIVPVVESGEARDRTEPPADVWSGTSRPLWVVPNLLGVESRRKKRILTAFGDIFI